MSMIKTITRRISCRSYLHDPLKQDTVIDLKDFLRADTEAPFGSKVRFRLFEFDHLSREEMKSCGTYGVIRGAREFIVGAVTMQPKAMEDYGYCMEKAILKATAMGLGTCWLGGTFNRSGFAERMQLTPDELLPAITPVGYASDKRTFVDTVFRFSAGSNKRKPWEDLFFDLNLKALKKEATGPYEAVLDGVRLGPSASNKQPWRIFGDLSRQHFHLYLQRTPGYSGIFGAIKLQNVDMGIAMCHFELSARELGLAGTWQIADPQINARKMEYIASWITK